MSTRLAIVGGPGAGKTRRMLLHVQAELDFGVPPERIGILTFTRAARDEVRDRLAQATGHAPERFPWLRTIHSAALRACGGARLMTDEAWGEFARLYGYDFSDLRVDTEDERVIPPSRTDDDQLRYVYEWGRNRGLDPEAAFDRRARAGTRRDLYGLFVRRYEEFKQARTLVDFADLLDRVLLTGVSLPVDVGFVDEAQDLSRIQAAVVESFYARCSRVYAAGDDDQAIYLFQGAQPEWFLRMAQENDTEFLIRSHRLPTVVHDFANRIIARNSNRIEKEFHPTTRAGVIQRVSYAGAMDAVDGSRSTLVLARNRIYLRDQALALQTRGVPYLIEGDGSPNPLGSPALVRAVNTVASLQRTSLRSISATALDEVARYVPKASALISDDVRGSLAEQRRAQRRFDVDDPGIARLVELARSEGPMAVFTGLHGEVTKYLGRLLEGRDELPKPQVVLTSIHGAKGREADHVVLLSDMTRATYDEHLTREGAEGEHRVFYVGVTRTRDRLDLVVPKTRRKFDYPAIPSEVRA